MINKKIFLYVGLIFLLSSPSITIAKEISIFDSSGEATAYIDTNDEQNIYLWDGEPVAYLDHDSIYGFNGKHLGWISDGILYDHDGHAVGFLDGSTSRPTLPEPIKGLQKLTPLKSLEELEPLQPLFQTQWESGLKYFLLNGKK
jgi:hypothetical protein